MPFTAQLTVSGGLRLFRSQRSRGSSSINLGDGEINEHISARREAYKCKDTRYLSHMAPKMPCLPYWDVRNASDPRCDERNSLVNSWSGKLLCQRHVIYCGVERRFTMHPDKMGESCRCLAQRVLRSFRRSLGHVSY